MQMLTEVKGEIIHAHTLYKQNSSLFYENVIKKSKFHAHHVVTERAANCLDL